MSDAVSAPPARSHRRLRLVVGTLSTVAVEVLIYRAYLTGDGSFHWFTHFFAGTSTALVVMTLVSLRLRRPIPLPLLWPVLGHMAAMGPDLMFVNEMAHRRWMDVFVAHNVSHFIPGRNVTWYLIFLSCLGVFLLVLPRPDQTRTLWRSVAL